MIVKDKEAVPHGQPRKQKAAGVAASGFFSGI